MTRILQVAPHRRGAYPTISEALRDAPADAIIEIAEGVYRESLSVAGKRIVLKAGGDTGAVTIEARGQSVPAISCTEGALTIEGLTIVADSSAGVLAERAELRMERSAVQTTSGAGISIRGGSADLRKCTVDGALFGILIEDADGTVDGCTVSNIAEDGLAISMGAAPVIRGVTITSCGNRGIYVYQYAKPVIEGCRISGTSGAGIMVTHKCAPTIRRCTIVDSLASGIVIGRGCSGLVEECQLENTAEPGIDVHPEAQTVVRERAESLTGGDADDERNPEVIAALLAELEAMVGLAAAKAEVKDLIDEIQVNEWRRNAGLSISSGSNNLIFTGAPGTGKTTVARIYGKLLVALGILPSGGFREVSRRDLVGQYLGHTAEKTSAVFEEATGGVLFIDEAYTLSRQAGSNDFGQESIDTLVKLMEDSRHEIAVIAAGYTREMLEFLDANPGLGSRFSRSIEFESYEPAELIVILTRMAEGDDYRLGDGVAPVLGGHFDRLRTDPNFGNAREARKLFEGMRKAQARRLRQLGYRPSLEDLRTLTAQDAEAAVQL